MVDVRVSGQTLYSQYYDTFDNGARGNTTFVFSPGYAQDTINGFRFGGANHDTVDLASSDFSSFAQVLRDTKNTSDGVVIHDPKSGDALTITGVSKAQLAHDKSDFTFHA